MTSKHKLCYVTNLFQCVATWDCKDDPPIICGTFQSRNSAYWRTQSLAVAWIFVYKYYLRGFLTCCSCKSQLASAKLFCTSKLVNVWVSRSNFGKSISIDISGFCIIYYITWRTKTLMINETIVFRTILSPNTINKSKYRSDWHAKDKSSSSANVRQESRLFTKIAENGQI